MKRLVIACAAVLFVHGPAFAQEAMSGENVAPAAVSPEKEALIRDFFEVTRVTETTEGAMRAMIPIAIEQMEKGIPNLSSERRAALVEAMHESVPPVAASILNAFVPVYDAAFTTEELRTITAFYRTPAAQVLLDKQPQLLAATTAITREIAPQFEAETLARFCAKVDCTPDATSDNGGKRS